MYRAVDLERRTVRQDHFIERCIRAAGIDKGITFESDNPDELLVRFRVALVDSGQACRLLSAFLLPQGMTERDWRIELAADTEEFLGGLHTDEDRQAVDDLCIHYAAGFLLRALRRAETSLSSLRQPTVAAPRLSNAAHAGH